MNPTITISNLNPLVLVGSGNVHNCAVINSVGLSCYILAGEGVQSHKLMNLRGDGIIDRAGTK
jgi:hypothetical protein